MNGFFCILGLSIITVSMHAADISTVHSLDEKVNQRLNGFIYAHEPFPQDEAESLLSDILLFVKDKDNIVHVTNEKSGYTLLHLATWLNHASFMKQLLKKGADINMQTRKRKETPVHICVRMHQDKKNLQLLLKQKPEVNKQDYKGETALHKLMRVYATHAKKPCSQDEQKNLEAIKKILLQAGAQTDIKNNDGYTPEALFAFCYVRSHPSLAGTIADIKSKQTVTDTCSDW